MNKKVILITLVVVLIGVVLYFYNSPFNSDFAQSLNNDLIGNDKVDEKVSVSKEIADLCTTSFAENSNWYPQAVYECGEYYEAFPPRNVLDAAISIIDKNGNVAAQCGGMPNPSSEPNPLCQLNCSEKNLCDGVVIDCENLLPGPQDGCNMENAIRTKDPKFCDLLKTGIYDPEGCREYVMQEPNN